MENVPSRLDEVYRVDLDKSQQPQVQAIKYNDQRQAYEFVIPYIDHSISYVLKYELEQMDQIEYVSIKQPHPLEKKMIIRVQLNEQQEVNENDGNVRYLFNKALMTVKDNLQKLNDIIDKSGMK